MRRRSTACLLGVLLVFSPEVALSQITLDGTLGPAGTPPRSGGSYTIGAELGQTRGGNLFHSFGQFNVQRGESATFTGPTAIQNILGRVTGGSASFIDGLLRSTIPAANLFLLNPRGVLFGPNATLDVRGAFHVSTADYIRLADGGRFAASPLATSTLTTASPAAFGFLGPNPAPITIAGSTLQVAPRQTLSLVGGDVQVLGAVLAAPGGRINVASVRSPGEVVVGTAVHLLDLSVEGFVRLGAVDVVQSTVDASGEGGGTVAIRGHAALIESSFVFADTLGSTSGAPVGIDIRTTGDVAVTDGAGVTTDVIGSGRGGDIRIAAANLEVSRGAFVGSRTFAGTGAAGSVSIVLGPAAAGGRLTLTDGGVIETSTRTAGRGGAVTISAADRVSIVAPDLPFLTGIVTNTVGTGSAGDVRIDAPLVEVVGGDIQAASRGLGRPGAVELNVDRLSLTRGGQIGNTFDASFRGTPGVPAPAGAPLTIAAREAVILDGFSLLGRPSFVGASGALFIAGPDVTVRDGNISGTTTSTARGADVVLDVGRLTVQGASRIASSTLGLAPAGQVRISAREQVSILEPDPVTGLISAIRSETAGASDGGRVSIAAPSLVMQGSAIQTRTTGTGRAGDIAIDVDRLTLAAGAQIDSSTAGSGAGGTISVTVRGPASIAGAVPGQPRTVSSIFSRAQSSGPAGSVHVRAGDLQLRGGGEITATSEAGGAAGQVVVVADTVAMSGQTTDGFGASGVSSRALAGGAGGSVDVTARQIEVRGGAQISTSSRGAGVGGVARVTATESLLLSDGGIIATAQATGDAGRIEVTAPTLVMERSTIETTTFASGRAGDIGIGVGRLEMNGSTSIDSSTLPFTTGRAGNVTIQASDRVVMTGTDNFISSVTAGTGEAGRVAISTPLLAMDRGRVATATLVGGGRAGDIEVDAGTVTLRHGSGLDSSTFTSGSGGTVRVTAAESVVVTGVDADTGLASSIASNAFGRGSAGEVTIATPVLRVADGAAVSAETAGAGRAGGITVQATDVTVTGAGRISSSTFGPGNGGPVAIAATGTVTAAGNGSNIVSSSSGSGHAGQLAITASILTVDGGMVGATALDVGDAGNVDIDVGRLAVTAAGVIDSSTLVQGRGGTVTITARDGVSISGRDAAGLLSRVSSSTIGTGAAGRVSISTPVLLVDGGLVSAVTGGTGRGGDVALNVGRLVVTNEGAVSADTVGSGAGGTLNVTATESVALSRGSFLSTLTAGPGHAGRLTLVTPELTAENGAAIAAPSGGTGAAGDVSVDVARLTLTGGAAITSSTEGAGAGGTVSVVARESVVVAGAGVDGKPSGITTRSLGAAAAGQVFVQAPALVLHGPAQISASTTGAGRAGDVRLAVDALSLTGGAVVSSETTGAGRGGTITVTGNTIDVAGSRISSNTSGTGTGGDIDLGAAEIRLADGALISSTSDGPGDAGNIRIAASIALESRGSAVTTGASSADGGNIAVGVGTLLRLIDSQITATVGGGEGRGGNIVIGGLAAPLGPSAIVSSQRDGAGISAIAGPVGFVTLQNSEIRADALRGPGGSVQIAADVVLSDRLLADIISASSAFGLSGTVSISSPITEISGTLAPLPENILVAASLLRESCGARFAERRVSSLAMGGRDGAPAAPGGMAPSPLVEVESPARAGARGTIVMSSTRLPVIELRCAR